MPVPNVSHPGERDMYCSLPELKHRPIFAPKSGGHPSQENERKGEKSFKKDTVGEKDESTK